MLLSPLIAVMLRPLRVAARVALTFGLACAALLASPTGARSSAC